MIVACVGNIHRYIVPATVTPVTTEATARDFARDEAEAVDRQRDLLTGIEDRFVACLCGGAMEFLSDLHWKQDQLRLCPGRARNLVLA